MDSDTDGEWSFSMATPACQRGPEKGIPQVVSSADESASSDDSLLSLRPGREKTERMSCEKLRNRVVLHKGEKVCISSRKVDY